MKFPLIGYKYEIPTGNEFGAFGTTRKFDVHTGVDLYCEELTEVVSIEDGEIVAVEWFTGEKVGMPWWNNTQAVAIKGKSGIINYGEILTNLKIGDKVTEGQLIGRVTPVLKKDKGKVPSTSMLHIEMYKEYDGDWSVWEIGQSKPDNLLDPTDLLISIRKRVF
jgi:murein DD-endopeptidase MepM/ murein hydrolase activator NlpD